MPPNIQITVFVRHLEPRYNVEKKKVRDYPTIVDYLQFDNDVVSRKFCSISNNYFLEALAPEAKFEVNF